MAAGNCEGLCGVSTRWSGRLMCRVWSKRVLNCTTVRHLTMAYERSLHASTILFRKQYYLLHFQARGMLMFNAGLIV